MGAPEPRHTGVVNDFGSFSTYPPGRRIDERKTTCGEDEVHQRPVEAGLFPFLPSVDFEQQTDRQTDT